MTGWRLGFGAFPRPVRDALRHHQDLMEANPDTFLRYDLPRLVDTSRRAIASYVHVPLNELVLIPNATTGVDPGRTEQSAGGGRRIRSATYGGVPGDTEPHLPGHAPRRVAAPWR